MKRLLLLAVLCVVGFGSFPSVSNARPHSRGRVAPPPSGKIAKRCPSKKRLDRLGIKACPSTGCGPAFDPKLNERKNIRSQEGAATAMTLQELKDLSDPVPGFSIGDDRQPLTDLGEGKKIQVTAFALVARKGSKESCNCLLGRVKDTDNHIVLVEEAALALSARATRARAATATRKAVKARTARQNTLRRREEESVTAEFTPRVRLDHPNLTGGRLQSLIEGTQKKTVLVRVTGLLMFDSQHSLERPLRRASNWEIHPVMTLEYCPKTKTCTADSDANWADLEDTP